MTHVHIDMAAVEAAIADSNKLLGERVDAPGYPGAYARLCLNVGTHWSRQLAVEINRSTTPDDLSFALGSLIANMIIDHARSIFEDDQRDLIAADINRTLGHVGRCLGQALSGQAKFAIERTVRGDAGGHA